GPGTLSITAGAATLRCRRSLLRASGSTFFTGLSTRAESTISPAVNAKNMHPEPTLAAIIGIHINDPTSAYDLSRTVFTRLFHKKLRTIARKGHHQAVH